jgi:hypothetical protein
LLQALDPAGSFAGPDPLDPALVQVRATRGGVSVAGPRFQRAAAEELARRDLAAWRDGEAGNPVRLQATAPGRAHLKRLGAGHDETRFLEQHLVLEEASPEPGAPALRVDAEESPLDWLRRRRDRNGEPLIDAAAHEAGERLRRDLTVAAILPGVTARWDPTGGGGGGRDPAAATDAMVAARQRVARALDAVGSDFADLLLDLCGFLKGLETLERERHWPVRSAKVVVRLALNRLAEHYGLSVEARGPGASRGVRAWREAAP